MRSLSYQEETLTPLFQIPVAGVSLQYSFLATDRWIVLSEFGWVEPALYVYGRNTQSLMSYDLEVEDAYNRVFLSEDTLILVGGFRREESLTTLNLSTGCRQSLDIGLDVNEADFLNASAVYDDGTEMLYLSVNSAPLPYTMEKSQSITIAVDLEQLSYETLNEKYYCALFMKNEKLYGVRHGIITPISMKAL